VIKDSQHGFVKGRSCLTNLIELFEKVTKQVDEGKAVDVDIWILVRRLIRFPVVGYCKKYKGMELRVI